ncbi:DUF2326 domain-containing protein [Stenoxybacter acetivorans]|uniref:DUF2326 domain-containing protein n=1 Tax=Stenoxybacter acetivorans TaxID=422441 RepID=UPI0014702E42|nr:DUF2326 domain-containing protein [Stenoxybacter acetivorans]
MDKKISELRRQEQQIARQIHKLTQFTKQANSDDVDVRYITTQYQSLSDSIAQIIHKTLDDCVRFRQSLAKERLAFYGGQLNHLNEQHTRIWSELTQYDKQRAALLHSVDMDNNASLSQAWGSFAMGKAQLEELKIQLARIDDIDQQLFDSDSTFITLKRAVLDALAACQELTDDISTTFNEICTAAFHRLQHNTEGAFLRIETNSNAHKNQLPINIQIKLPATKSLGNSQLQQVVYDLTVLFNILKHDLQLPRFLIHDGIFHGIENLKRVNLLNYLYQQSKTQSFQYIATFNAEEIELTEENQQRGIHYDFNLAEQTILYLEDVPDKMLFKHRFD